MVFDIWGHLFGLNPISTHVEIQPISTQGGHIDPPPCQIGSFYRRWVNDSSISLKILFPETFIFGTFSKNHVLDPFCMIFDLLQFWCSLVSILQNWLFSVWYRCQNWSKRPRKLKFGKNMYSSIIFNVLKASAISKNRKIVIRNQSAGGVILTPPA